MEQQASPVRSTYRAIMIYGIALDQVQRQIRTTGNFPEALVMDADSYRVTLPLMAIVRGADSPRIGTVPVYSIPCPSPCIAVIDRSVAICGAGGGSDGKSE